MTYRERWIKAIARKPKGLFGREHEWTYALMDGPGTERRMIGSRKLLDELVPDTNFSGNDAYLCLDRAHAAFLTGSKNWIGYPSGSEVEDPLTANWEAVTLDMLAFSTLLRVYGRAGAGQRYQDMAMELRTEATEESVEAARAEVAESLRGGAGSLNDVVIHKRDATPDAYLSQWYDALRGRLWAFSVGGKRCGDDAPERDRKS
ncbi:hypothetical protein [Arthrobacter sp. Ld5]|uniref:hypothetical protein n=1 Tax=Arthrobacter sp. Ld5 TaxID=649152 RepID=UPI003EBFCF67